MSNGKKPVKNAGSRGGKFYINGKGKVVYGEKSKGMIKEHGSDQEHERIKYDPKIEFKEQFPSFDKIQEYAKEKGVGFSEKDYKQLYQREHKAYMKEVNDAKDKGKEIKGLGDKKQFLNDHVKFDEKTGSFKGKSWKDVEEEAKKAGIDLTKEEFMKHYKQEKYAETKWKKANKDKDKEPDKKPDEDPEKKKVDPDKEPDKKPDPEKKVVNPYTDFGTNVTVKMEKWVVISEPDKKTGNTTFSENIAYKNLGNYLSNYDKFVVETPHGLADKRLKILNDLGFEVVYNHNPNNTEKHHLDVFVLQRKKQDPEKKPDPEKKIEPEKKEEKDPDLFKEGSTEFDHSKFPKLEGSFKQQKWAWTIRGQFMKKVSGELEGDMPESYRNVLKTLASRMLSNTDSKHWIENREKSLKEMLMPHAKDNDDKQVIEALSGEKKKVEPDKKKTDPEKKKVDPEKKKVEPEKKKDTKKELKENINKTIENHKEIANKLLDKYKNDLVDRKDEWAYFGQINSETGKKFIADLQKEVGFPTTDIENKALLVAVWRKAKKDKLYANQDPSTEFDNYIKKIAETRISKDGEVFDNPYQKYIDKSLKMTTEHIDKNFKVDKALKDKLKDRIETTVKNITSDPYLHWDVKDKEKKEQILAKDREILGAISKEFENLNTPSEVINHLFNSKKELNKQLNSIRSASWGIGKFKTLENGKKKKMTDEERTDAFRMIYKEKVYNNIASAVIAHFWENGNVEKFYKDAVQTQKPGNKSFDLNKIDVEITGLNNQKEKEYRDIQLKAVANFYNKTVAPEVLANMDKISIRQSGARACSSGTWIKVNAFGSADKEQVNGTTVHELGHVMEHLNEEIRFASTFFRAGRTDKMGTYKLNDMTKAGYGKDELAQYDTFHDPYVGKDYAIGGSYSLNRGFSEVYTMGMQEFVDPKKALRLFINDPEHFSLIHGINNGLYK